MKTKSIAALLIGLALLAAAGLLGASAEQAGLARPAYPGTDAPRQWPALGVNVALEQYDSAQRAAALDAMAEAGFSWVRQRFPWDEIEPQPGEFRWAQWDAIVQAVAERNLALVAVLDGAPGWARSPIDADNPLAPPRQRADFGRFAAAFASRYGDRVRFYQVWDEPNIAPHWGARPVDAADYAGLLREAAIQLRAADPDAVVLLAGLAPTVEPGGLNQSDLAFLEALYQAGAAPWFDAAAGQPYGFEQPPAAPADAQALNFGRAELLAEVMRRQGDAGTRLWLTAYGWHAAPAGQAAGDSPWGSVDEATQARWAGEAAEWARRQWPWLGGLAWAWWQPPQPASDPHWGFALVDALGERRPALAALAGWAGQSHALGPGAWPLDNAALQAAGGWRLTAQAADPPQGAQAGNNRLIVPFEGNGLALGVQRGAYWGYLTVTVDGQPANALPKDEAGRANLALYDPLAGEETVTVASGLPEGPHVAEIVATGGWEQWPLRQIIVLNSAEAAQLGAAPWPTWLPWALALAGLFSLALAHPATRRLGLIPLSRLAALLTLLPVLMAFVGQRPAVRYGLLLALLAIAFFTSGWLPAVALGLMGLLFVPFLDAGLFVLALTTPLTLTRISLLGRPVSPPEAVVWLAGAALLVNLLMIRMTRDTGVDMPTDDGTMRRVRLVYPRLRWTALDWGVAALLAVAALSVLAAQNLGVASHELRTVIVSGVLAYGVLRLAPPLTAGRGFDVWPAVWGIGLGAGLVAGWGLSQALTGSGLITAEGVLRVRGPYGSPNNLALYLSHALPILLAVAALANDQRKRLAAALLALLCAAALALTFSKGALLLGVPAAVLFLGFAAGGRWRWLALAAVTLAGLLMLPLFRTERFADLFDLSGGTGFLRLQLWRGAWNMVREHPWLGVGLDNFLYAYRTRYVLPAAWQELNLSHPHNILLDLWTRLGLLGVIVGAWLFGAAFWQGWRGLRRLGGDRRALMLGLLASLVATLAHGLIDNSLFLAELMILFMLSLGLIARLAADNTFS